MEAPSAMPCIPPSPQAVHAAMLAFHFHAHSGSPHQSAELGAKLSKPFEKMLAIVLHSWISLRVS